MKDNDEDVNQFEEMPLFTDPMNIKRIEKDFDKNLMTYMRYDDNGNLYEINTLMVYDLSVCEKVAMENLYENFSLIFPINI